MLCCERTWKNTNEKALKLAGRARAVASLACSAGLLMATNPLKSLGDYSRLIAELLSQPNIQSSTVAVWPDSPYTGIAEGDVMFTNGLRLRHHRIPALNMSFERPMGLST